MLKHAFTNPFRVSQMKPLNIPEPAVETVSFVPSEKEALRKQIDKAYRNRKNKISQKLPANKAGGRLIGFYSVKRSEPAGVFKDEHGQTFLTGDTTPVQMISSVRSKRSGAWAHGKKR